MFVHQGFFQWEDVGFETIWYVVSKGAKYDHGYVGVGVYHARGEDSILCVDNVNVFW